jgi:hypothetical protein
MKLLTTIKGVCEALDTIAEQAHGASGWPQLLSRIDTENTHKTRRDLYIQTTEYGMINLLQQTGCMTALPMHIVSSPYELGRIFEVVSMLFSMALKAGS